MSQSEVADYQTLEDHPLALYFFPRRLQSLASAKIASSLWRHKIDAMNTWDHLSLAWFHDQRFSCGDLLPIPSTITDLIDKSIDQMVKRVESWVIFYAMRVFDGCEVGVVIGKCIRCIEVFDDNETIAAKLLASNKLTPAEKYRLACMFCRKHDVERFWPMVLKNSLITGVTFEDDYLLYYWNCMMKGITPQVPGDSNDSIDLRMISYDRMINEQAIGYFWNKLSFDERMSIVNEVLIRSSHGHIMLTLLPKLNSVLVHHVLESIAGQIITTLASKIDNSEYLSQIWIYVQDLASLDVLYDILLQLFDLAFVPVPFRTFEEGFRASEVLYELWMVASDSLRSYVSNNHVETIFKQLCDIEFVRLPDCYHRDMKFLLDLLAKVDLPTRNQIWCENWCSLMIRAEPAYLDRFLMLCFATDDEIVRFKEDVMMDYDEIDCEVEAFVNYGYCDELAKYVDFCSSDKQRVENLRRRIIAPLFVVTNLSDRDRLQKLVKFIDDTFESAELADRFKEEFVMSLECEMLKCLYASLDVGCLNGLINIRYFLSSEHGTNQVKQECLKRCRGCLINTKFTSFDVDVWKEFITWCTGSRENWWAFRRSLPVTEIFDRLLTKVIRGYAYPQPSTDVLLSFTPLNNFLMWIYVNKEIVKNYKVSVLKNGSCRTLRITLEKNWGTIVDIVLMWVFDNDVKQLHEFKATLKPNENETVV